MNTLPPFLALCLAVIFGLQANAQIDPMFVQPTQVPLNYNPAFAGVEDKGRVSTAYWDWGLGYRFSFRGAFASWDQEVPQLKGGVGVSARWINYDGWDFYRLEATYGLKFRLGNGMSLHPGLGLSANVSQLPERRFVRDEWGKIYEAAGDSSDWFPNANVGLVAKGDRFYVGLGASNLNRTRIVLEYDFLTVDLQRPSVNLMGGYYFRSPNPKDWELGLHGLVNYTGRFDYLVQLNANFRYKKLLLGVGNLNIEKFNGTLGFENNHLRIAYSFMVNTRYPSRFFMGWAHEISCVVFLPQSK